MGLVPLFFTKTNEQPFFFQRIWKLNSQSTGVWSHVEIRSPELYIQSLNRLDYLNCKNIQVNGCDKKKNK